MCWREFFTFARIYLYNKYSKSLENPLTNRNFDGDKAVWIGIKIIIVKHNLYKA